MHFKAQSTFILWHFILLGFILSGLLFSGAAHADIDEIYHLSIGTNLERYNTEFSIDSNNQSNSGAIDFEDDLGYDSRISAIWVSAWYRVGDLHRIRMTYTPLNRSANVTSTKDIEINNAIIKAGAEISTRTETDILDFSYVYSFHKSAQLEMGVSVGVYWLLNSTAFQASGEIQFENEDQPTLKTDFFSQQKLQAPMPLIGVSANYEISPSWRTHAALRYLNVQLNDVDGRISSAEIGTEYYFNSNWGAGLSINYFDLNVEVNGLLSSTELGWAHNGVQIYLAFKY